MPADACRRPRVPAGYRDVSPSGGEAGFKSGAWRHYYLQVALAVTADVGAVCGAVWTAFHAVGARVRVALDDRCFVDLRCKRSGIGRADLSFK